MVVGIFLMFLIFFLNKKKRRGMGISLREMKLRRELFYLRLRVMYMLIVFRGRRVLVRDLSIVRVVVIEVVF